MALFGLMESGVFQTKWALQLGPTLLASPPRPEQLAALKEILAGGQKAGEDGGGRFPVVLRLGGEGALHLLPPELWVGDVSAIEGSLDRGASLFILGLTRGKKEFPRRVFFERCGIRLAYRRGYAVGYEQEGYIMVRALETGG